MVYSYEREMVYGKLRTFCRNDTHWFCNFSINCCLFPALLTYLIFIALYCSFEFNEFNSSNLNLKGSSYMVYSGKNR